MMKFNMVVICDDGFFVIIVTHTTRDPISRSSTMMGRSSTCLFVAATAVTILLQVLFVRNRIFAQNPAPAMMQQQEQAIAKNHHNNRPNLYRCGWWEGFELFASSVFPDYNQSIIDLSDLEEVIPPDHASTSGKDVTIYGRYGPCPSHVKEWLQTSYKGKILSINGEPGKVPRKWRKNDLKSENVYVLGPAVTSSQQPRTNRSMIFPYGVLASMSTELLPRRHYRAHQLLVNHTLKPKNDRSRFLIYAARRCVVYRDEAFQELSRLRAVERVGSCHGTDPSVNISHREGFSSQRWSANPVLYREYRFCLCMENSVHSGYITEKIVMAFLGGCIPIYYGTPDVFDIFNKDAFVYYNISDPQPALKHVAYLERNRTAYEEMLSLPVLANGDKTIEDYFSFTDDVGGGKLKRRIRAMLDIK